MLKKGKFSLSEKKIMSNTYLNKLPCRNYLEKPGNKNALDNKAFLVIIKLLGRWKQFTFKTLEKFDYNCTALSKFLTHLITLSYVIWVDENSMRDLN